MKVYRQLACYVDAYNRCLDSGRTNGPLFGWASDHREKANDLVRNCLPSGSGWDNGTTILWEPSTSEKLVFAGSYHHMDDVGYYVGWSYWTITVTASLVYGLSIEVTCSEPNGQDTWGLDDYLGESFFTALDSEV